MSVDVLKKSPEGGRLCKFRVLVNRPLLIHHPKNHFRTQRIVPNTTIELDEIWKKHTFALKFLGYVYVQQFEGEKVVEPKKEEVKTPAAKPEKLEAETEFLNQEADQTTRVDELYDVATALITENKKNDGSFESLNVQELSEFVNARGLYCKKAPKSPGSNYPSRDEMLSIAKFGYTRDDDEDKGQLNTYLWASRWFKKTGKFAKLADLYESNDAELDTSLPQKEVIDHAFANGWFGLDPMKLHEDYKKFKGE